MSIPEEYKQKVEFLINAICYAGCIFRKQHYDINSMRSLSYGHITPLTNCKLQHTTLDNKQNINFNLQDIFTYAANGFENFKIEGRILPQSENLANFLKFLIQPEYMPIVINELIPYLFKDENYILNITI